MYSFQKRDSAQKIRLYYCLSNRLFGNVNRYIFFALKLKHLTHMANLNRLKVVLAEQEKTGKWILEQIGKSNYTVSKWCSNKVQPDLQTLDRIAKVLMLTKEC